jgi:hypothetical protein
MIRTITMLVVAALLMLAMAVPAFAVSPSQEECEAAGGTFTRTQGEVECILVEEGKNPKFTETETTTGQGNIANKTEEEVVCGGTGSGKCPPGQF